MDFLQRLSSKRFLTAVLRKEILPQFPGLVRIKKTAIKIKRKKDIGELSHWVAKLEAVFLDRRGRPLEVPVFFIADTLGGNEQAFAALEYLHSAGFGNGTLIVPRPLFFSKKKKALFYLGVEGDILLARLKTGSREEAKMLLSLAAAWLAKLHNLEPEKATVAKIKEGLEDAYPGREIFLSFLREKSLEHHEFYKRLYLYFCREEKKIVPEKDKCLVHGDAHPKNFIFSLNGLAAVDFDDFCFSDPARDIGCFVWQLAYMTGDKVGRSLKRAEARNVFLKSYAKAGGHSLTKNFKKRIEFYENWTAFRTAVYFALRHFEGVGKRGDLSAAEEILEGLEKKLKIYEEE